MLIDTCVYILVFTLLEINIVGRTHNEYLTNKRPTGLNGHLSIRDSTMTSLVKITIHFIKTMPQNREKDF